MISFGPLLLLLSFFHLATAATTNATLFVNPPTAVADQPTALNISIYDGSSNLTVGALLPTNDRIAHVLAISPDLTTLIHLHPEDFGSLSKNSSVLQFNITFPSPGDWLFAVEYAFSLSNNTRMTTAAEGEYEANVVTIQYPVSSITDEASSIVPLPGRNNVSFFGLGVLDAKCPDRFVDPINVTDLMQLNPAMAATTEERYIVSMDANTPILSNSSWILPANRCVLLSFSYYINDGDVAELKDLRPMMDATVHLTLVDENMTTVSHLHGIVADETTSEAMLLKNLCGIEETVHSQLPAVPGSFGPDLVAAVTLPNVGKYRVFLQAARDAGTDGGVKANDVLLTTAFTLEARASNGTTNGTDETGVITTSTAATQSTEASTGTISETATATASESATPTRTAIATTVEPSGTDTATPTATSTPIPEPSSGGMSTGAIVGISMAVLAGCGVGGFIFLNHQQRKKREQQWEQQSMVEAGIGSRNVPKNARNAPYVELYSLNEDDDDDAFVTPR